MRIHHIRWARLCVAATSTTLLAGGASAASASRSHKIQTGETLSALSREFHVSVRAIASANGLSIDDALTIGHKLIIPNKHAVPSKHAALRASLPEHRALASGRHSVINADDVCLRAGAGKAHDMIAGCTKGMRVRVTAHKGDWLHVVLTDGATGWVRSDFVSGARKSAQVAESTPRRKHHRAEQVASHRRHQSTEQVASHRRHQSTAKVASHRRHYVAQEVASRPSRRHRKSLQVAQGSRHGGRYIAEADRPTASNDIIRTAYAYRGTPYVYGGAGRGGFDCSGFTSYLYGRKGVSLPHSASAQFRVGHHVGRSDLKAGDLVFFETVHKGISHVGMYVGGGRFVHASSRRSGGVRVDRLDTGYYNERLRGARRYKK